MKDASMGQRAVLGGDWQPAGIVSRKMAEMLTKPAGGASLGQLVAKYQETGSNAAKVMSSKAVPHVPPKQPTVHRSSPSRSVPATVATKKSSPINWSSMVGTAQTMQQHQQEKQQWPRIVPTGRAATIAAANFNSAPADRKAAEGSRAMPSRLALGTASSPTVLWYPTAQDLAIYKQAHTSAS